MYKDFKDMQIWQDSMLIAERIFILTENLPRKEDYSLTSQIRRSALSISANISEAFGRKHTLDKLKFYYYSRGSILETRSHLENGKRVKYFNESDFLQIDNSLNKVHLDLNKIIKTLMNNKNES